MKTAKGLVDYCKNALAQGWVYWYGTTGVPCTEDLLKRKTAQYPKEYTDNRMSRYKADIKAGKMCADCVNLIKGYMWSDDATGRQIYCSNGQNDCNADGLYNSSKIKGKINDMPDVAGIIVHKAGHVGVYVGDGWVIEARGFVYGVVKSRLCDRGFTDWFYHPCLDYENDIKKVDTDKVLRRGCKGEDVKTLQRFLMSRGYALPKYGADGDFGTETENALKCYLFDKDGKAATITLKELI